MKARIYALIATVGILLGSLALTAGTASASVTDHNPQPVQTRFSDGNPRADLFVVPRQRDRDRRFFCTREDRRLEFWLLRQRHLDRFQRAELRFLERICDDDFLFVSPFSFPR
jgi:hypothetical protein